MIKVIKNDKKMIKEIKNDNDKKKCLIILFLKLPKVNA